MFVDQFSLCFKISSLTLQINVLLYTQDTVLRNDIHFSEILTIPHSVLMSEDKE